MINERVKNGKTGSRNDTQETEAHDQPRATRQFWVVDAARRKEAFGRAGELGPAKFPAPRQRTKDGSKAGSFDPTRRVRFICCRRGHRIQSVLIGLTLDAVRQACPGLGQLLQLLRAKVPDDLWPIKQ